MRVSFRFKKCDSTIILKYKALKNKFNVILHIFINMKYLKIIFVLFPPKCDKKIISKYFIKYKLLKNKTQPKDVIFI